MENKNIYTLPTDKPSRLFIGKIKKELFLFNECANNTPPIGQNQNINVTSDEEIKDGDWVLFKNNWIKKCNNKEEAEIYNNDDRIFKITLTTDQDLIADRIQSIPDDFLEWFVKNPSCEIVEILNQSMRNNVEQKMDYKYKIIIPKEPKQDTVRPYSAEQYDSEVMPTVKKEPKQDLEKEMFELEQELDIPSHLRWHNSKPEQEICSVCKKNTLVNSVCVNCTDLLCKPLNIAEPNYTVKQEIILEEVEKQISLTEARGEKIVKYLDRYKGQSIYNEIALAIEFGYQIKLEEDEK